MSGRAGVVPDSPLDNKALMGPRTNFQANALSSRMKPFRLHPKGNVECPACGTRFFHLQWLYKHLNHCPGPRR